MGGRYKSLAKDTILFGISSFSSKIMIFLLLPIYTKILTTEEYGEADILINLVNLLYPLLTLSIVEAVLRFAFAKDVRKNELVASSLTIILFGVVALLVLTPFSVMFGQIMHDNWFLFIALFAGYSLQSLFASYCRGSNRSRLFAIQGIFQTVVLLAYNLIFLIFLKMGKEGYLFANICTYFTTVLFIIFAGRLYTEFLPLKINFILIKDMLKYCIPLIPAMMAWWVNISADKYTIIGIIGIGASGVYAVAHKIPTILTTVSDIFNQAFLISAVNNISDEDSAIYFKNVSKYFFIVNCFACSILIMFSEIVARILFSKEYFDGWVYVPILLVAALFSSLSAYLASFFRTIKNTKILLKSTVIGAIINIVLNVVLISFMGTIGAACASAISFGVVFIVRNYSLKKLIYLKFFTTRNCLAISMIIIQAVLMSLNLKIRYIISMISLLLMVIIYYEDIRFVAKTIRSKQR